MLKYYVMSNCLEMRDNLEILNMANSLGDNLEISFKVT
jgi:hypothetical protein